jgi:adenylosuccinate synthase
VSALCLTKLDVLDGLDTIRICTSYEIPDGQGGMRRIDRLPTGAAAVAQCRAVFEEMEGWTQDTKGLRDISQLPAAARRYIDRLAELAGVPIDIISTGPDREETIVLRHPFR